MTDLGIAGNWGTGRTARLIKGLPLPITVRQALSNIVQKKGRLLLTGITLTLASAAFMGVFAVFNLITSEINKLYETFNYDLMIIPTEAHDFNQVKDMVMSVEGVSAVTPGVGFLVKILDLSGTPIKIGSTGSEELQAFGYDPVSDAFKLTYDAGTGWQDDPSREGILLTTKAAEALHKTTGDQIVISAGGRTAEYEVIGLISYPFEFALMKWQDLARLAGFVASDGETPLPNVFFVRLQSPRLKATAWMGISTASPRSW